MIIFISANNSLIKLFQIVFKNLSKVKTPAKNIYVSFEIN